MKGCRVALAMTDVKGPGGNAVKKIHRYFFFRYFSGVRNVAVWVPSASRFPVQMGGSRGEKSLLCHPLLCFAAAIAPLS